jgi:multidrug resistance efflux pump
MMRLLAFPLVIFMGASMLAQEELPLPTDPNEPLDIEPPLLIQQVPGRDLVQTTSGVAAELDPELIQVALEKAKKSAAAGERLFRSGVIAKVEAENRALKVVRLEADLANARLDVAKQNLASQQSRFDAAEIPQSELEQARTALAAATTEAATATAQREKAELDAAFLNLNRQKKLLAMGSGRKSEVSRAEEKVAALQQQKN